MQSRDMVEVAPQNCKVLFENDQIRLVEVTLKPGEMVPMHSHHSVAIWFASRPARAREITPGRGEPKVIDLQPGHGRFHVGPYEHSIENVGETLYRSLAIELKQMTELKEHAV